MKLKYALLALGLGSSALCAQTAVRQLDADTLLIELQYGKPPHGRLLIERENDPAVFATFDDMRTQPKRNFLAHFFGGAPGKSHYHRPGGTEMPVQETSQFPQIEARNETEQGRVQHWHGAPGKGSPLR